jgi:hypothetical protein
VRVCAMYVVALIGLWIILSIATTPIIGAFLSPAQQDRARRASALATGKADLQARPGARDSRDEDAAS